MVIFQLKISVLLWWRNGCQVWIKNKKIIFWAKWQKLMKSRLGEKIDLKHSCVCMYNCDNIKKKSVSKSQLSFIIIVCVCEWSGYKQCGPHEMEIVWKLHWLNINKIKQWEKGKTDADQSVEALKERKSVDSFNKMMINNYFDNTVIYTTSLNFKYITALSSLVNIVVC